MPKKPPADARRQFVGFCDRRVLMITSRLCYAVLHHSSSSNVFTLLTSGDMYPREILRGIHILNATLSPLQDKLDVFVDGHWPRAVLAPPLQIFAAWLLGPDHQLAYHVPQILVHRPLGLGLVELQPQVQPRRPLVVPLHAAPGPPAEEHGPELESGFHGDRFLVVRLRELEGRLVDVFEVGWVGGETSADVVDVADLARNGVVGCRVGAAAA